MHKKIFLLCCLLLAAVKGFSQQKKAVISGFVVEKSSQEPLIGVTIYAPQLKVGTTSNTYGFYSLTLPADTVTILVSYVGFERKMMQLDLRKGDLELNHELENITLKGVVVKADAPRKVSEESRMSVIDIPVQQIKDIPALLGEKDVLKVIQLMPGVQKGSEGSSGLYVRGGGPDQNLIILDEATVYNANHLFGFFSIFNGDALKSVELTKGGFPARYGGRLSSVLDMNMKDGNRQKFKGEAGIGLISSRLTLEGPLVKGKSSFLISGRRTYADLIARPFMPSNTKFGYYFYDLNAKVNYDLGKKDKLFLSGYFGQDRFWVKMKESNSLMDLGFNWGNATGTLRWNHVFNKKWFANASLIYSHYKMDLFAKEKFGNETFELRYSSGIDDYSGKYTLDYFHSAAHHFKMGLQTTYHTFTPSAFVLKGSVLPQDIDTTEQTYAWESGVFIEDEIMLGTRWKANLGFRVSHFLVEDKNYFGYEPRANLAYRVGKNTSLKASYALMNQYIHLLSNTGVGLPTDLWVPTTDKVKPQRSNQVAVGVAHDLREGLALTVEGYYKVMDNIVAYKEGASFLVINAPGSQDQVSWEDNITQGKGESYGAELLLQKKTGKLTGWIGYTLSWTWSQFDDLNFGERFHPKYDRRHDFGIVAIYKIKDNITLSGTWVYGTGNAITLPLSTYNSYVHSPFGGYTNGNPNGSNLSNYFRAEEFGQKNSFRMAAYHRADVGIQFSKERKHFTRIFELSFYNLYNRKNPFFYYTDNNKLKQVSLFPVIPSVSWTFKF